MQWSFLSSPRGGRAGQLQKREVSSALLWSCTAVTFSIPRDTPVPEQWPWPAPSGWCWPAPSLLQLGSEFIMKDRALAALFSPFPTFFSFSFPFHPYRLSHQVTLSLDVLLFHFLTLGTTSQMWNSPSLHPSSAHHQPVQTWGASLSSSKLCSKKFGRSGHGWSTTAVESRCICVWSS